MSLQPLRNSVSDDTKRVVAKWAVCLVCGLGAGVWLVAVGEAASAPFWSTLIVCAIAGMAIGRLIVGGRK